MIFNIYNIHHASHKRIPVTEQVWKELAEMKSACQTYDYLLAEMIEVQKKRRLVEDIQRSIQEDDFVPLSEMKS